MGAATAWPPHPSVTCTRVPREGRRWGTGSSAQPLSSLFSHGTPEDVRAAPWWDMQGHSSQFISQIELMSTCCFGSVGTLVPSVPQVQESRSPATEMVCRRQVHRAPILTPGGAPDDRRGCCRQRRPPADESVPRRGSGARGQAGRRQHQGGGPCTRKAHSQASRGSGWGAAWWRGERAQRGASQDRDHLGLLLTSSCLIPWSRLPPGRARVSRREVNFIYSI